MSNEVNPPLQRLPHTGRILWLYGRSGAGKTTLALMMAEALKKQGHPVFVVDGDNLRSGLCRDLGFDETSRMENHRRAAELAKLAVRQGFTVVGATMCPLHENRTLIREILGEKLCLVYLAATHEECALRDSKGLYRQFAEGKLEHFEKSTFHEPHPSEYEVIIHTGTKSLLVCISEIEAYLESSIG